MNKRRKERIEKRKRLQEWSKTVRSNYNNKCFVPNCKRVNLDAHHVIGKEIEETRYDLENGVALCKFHHKLGKFSAHRNSLWFIELLSRLEPEKYNYLMGKVLMEYKKVKD